MKPFDYFMKYKKHAFVMWRNGELSGVIQTLKYETEKENIRIIKVDTPEQFVLEQELLETAKKIVGEIKEHEIVILSGTELDFVVLNLLLEKFGEVVYAVLDKKDRILRIRCFGIKDFGFKK